jgi:hypothetical protein
VRDKRLWQIGLSAVELNRKERDIAFGQVMVAGGRTI